MLVYLKYLNDIFFSFQANIKVTQKIYPPRTAALRVNFLSRGFVGVRCSRNRLLVIAFCMVSNGNFLDRFCVLARGEDFRVVL